MDWIRLGSSGTDLSGTKGAVIPVSHAELAKHCTLNDAWLAIRGKCYNVTRYMNFHPGGNFICFFFILLFVIQSYLHFLLYIGSDELLKGAGKDATKMFDEVHAWVNFEQLLIKCYIGPLINTATIQLDTLNIGSSPQKSALKKLTQSTNSSSLGTPAFSTFKTPILPFLQSSPLKLSKTTPAVPDSPQESEIIPRFDWIQKTAELMIVFYTKAFCNPSVWISMDDTNCDNEVVIRILIERTLHICTFKFAHSIEWPCSIRTSYETGD